MDFGDLQKISDLKFLVSGFSYVRHETHESKFLA